MPVTLLYVISLLIVIALSSGGIVFFRKYLNKKGREYENQISKLEQDLATANTRLTQETEKLKTIQGTNEYEKYAGIVLARMDRAVIIINQDRTLGLINEYAKQFLDLAAEIGMPYKNIIHLRTGGQSDNFALFESAFAGKPQPAPSSMDLVSPRGTFPISGTILPIMTGQTVAAVIFIFDDNSKQVAKVKEEQAFFSAAAHELRTPLTIIRMTVELLREKFDSLPREKIAEHLRRTDETTEQMVKLVNDFLNISRIDQGRLELKPERFDLITMTDEVIGNLAFLAKEHNLYVHHEINVSERMVVADRAKAVEVLSNLISNGLKYTIQGGLTITHTITSTTLTTTIADTGTGIQRESQSLLFKRFGQIGEARSLQPTKSSGLGLYISKKLAELMRGDVILVTSAPGTGSTFAFSLPLR